MTYLAYFLSKEEMSIHSIDGSRNVFENTATRKKFYEAGNVNYFSESIASRHLKFTRRQVEEIQIHPIRPHGMNYDVELWMFSKIVNDRDNPEYFV